MGFNTVAFFSNDAADLFEKHPKETIDNLLDGMNGGRKSYKGSYGVGNHANPMKVMKTRHADDSTVYVFMGNTLCEMQTYNEETENLMRNHPEFFKQMLNKMQQNATSLKKKFKEIQNEQK